MNLLQMRNSLRIKIGNPTTVDVADNYLNEKLNQATTDIADRYRFHRARKRCRFTTSAGVPSYSLPSDVLAVLRIQDLTNFKKLEKTGDRQFSSRTDDTTSDKWGKPLQYTRYRDYVELQPVPDGVYTMEVFYKYIVEEMTEDADNPSLPPSWHPSIVQYAKFLYYDDQGDIPKKQDAYETFKLLVSDKPTEIDEESVDIDSGVEILSLSQNVEPRQDFNHAD